MRPGLTICEEVEVELVIWKLELVDLLHAQELVEGYALFGVLHPEHGMVELPFLRKVRHLGMSCKQPRGGGASIDVLCCESGAIYNSLHIK